MHPDNEKRSSNNTVAGFYDGKTIFITGAAGYLGVFLLEMLLRCCPGIYRIYILLRSKKGVLPECRKDAIFKKEIFSSLRIQNPGVFDKVHVIAGDISCQNLGMTREDCLKVAQEATVIFHCAAAISFLKPLRYTLFQNTCATDNVLEFCRKLKKLDVLIYTSTAYSNSNREAEIDEKIYKLPYPAQVYLDEVRNSNSDSDLILSNQCTPNWPNFYTYSKCLAENIIAEKAADLPIVIIRPSIITSCWKGILPGYVEEGSGMVGLSLGIGKGFIRVIHCDSEKNIDHVPVDIVANTHIVAGWACATEKCSSPFIVNCTSGELAPCKWGHYVETLLSMSLKYPLPKSYQRPALKVYKSPIGYWFYSILEHYAPAVAIDTLLWLSGRKPKLVSLYQFFDKSMKAVHHFVTHEWFFRCENFKQLANDLKPDDSEIFYVGLDGYSVDAFACDLPKAAPFYKWDIDNKKYEERMRTTYIRYLLTTSIKWLVVASTSSILFAAAFKVYQRFQEFLVQ